MRRAHRGNTLVATLAVVAIVLVLLVVFFKGNLFGGSSISAAPRQDHLGTTVPGGVRYAALDSVCQNNLDQIRQFIRVYEATSGDDQPPASLSDAKVPSSILTCPIDHQPYVYDPSSGKVHCAHAGHEQY